MPTSRSHTWIFVSLIVLVGIGVLAMLGKYLVNDRAVPPLSEFVASSTAAVASSSVGFDHMLKAPKGSISVFIATSTADQEKGLGDRDFLPSNQGMLFSFNSPSTYGFWMKDMRFALDMVWIDARKVVRGVTSDIPADTYPTIYTPPSAILYVLELNAGRAHDFGIATGTVLSF